MNRFVLAALIPFAASPALAGNVAPVLAEPVPVAPPAPVYSWSGPYIGGQINYAEVTTDGDLNVDGDGALYGLRAGYDFARGRLVYGPMFQYDIGSIDLDDTDIEVEDVLRLGGRVGYDLGRTLVYGSLGYSEVGTDDVGDADGYFIGFGSETYVTERVTVGIETIYHDFDDFDDASGVDADAATVGLNLNFRF